MNNVAPSPTPDAGRSGESDSPALAWFKALQDNPGARARLRRCRSPVEAMLEPAAIQLATRLGVLNARSRASDDRVPAALDLARVLAHVKEHDGRKRVMQSAGWKTFAGDRNESDGGDDRPRLSQARFRRLLATSGGEPLVVAFVRLIRLLEDGKVNVVELSNDFLGWTDPTRSAGVRRRWAFDYFAAGVAAPQTSGTFTDSEAKP